MRTLDRYHAIHAPMTCSDKITNYYKISSLILGLLMLLFGLFSFGLGIAAICTASSAMFIGFGIWCGFIFSVTGIIFIAAFSNTRACLITTALVFSLISLFCAAVQFSLGILGTNTDASRNSFQTSFGPGQYAYDIFNSLNIYQFPYCTGYAGYSWQQSWAPINILLLICGFLELIFSFSASILTCAPLCCGRRHLVDVSGESNLGYFANGQNMDNSQYISKDPVYKLTM